MTMCQGKRESVESRPENLMDQTMLSAQLLQCSRQWFSIAWRVVRDVDAAEDICQQAVLKACQRDGGWRDVHAFRGWMSRVVTNQAIDELRRRHRERAMHEQHAHAPPREPAPEPDKTVAMQESLRRALDQLPADVREVTVMRVVAGLSGKETASALDMSAATVSRRLHEGFSLLRQHLGDWQSS